MSELIQCALELGFDLAGILSAEKAETFGYFDRWISENHHAGMSYLEKYREARRHPESILSGVNSLIVLAMAEEKIREEEPPFTIRGATVACYALGADYHQVMRGKLDRLADFHHKIHSGEKTRGVVDTAPILEREYACRAGLGWFGKNSMLINEKLGSRFFIGILLSTAVLRPIPMQENFSSVPDYAPDLQSSGNGNDQSGLDFSETTRSKQSHPLSFCGNCRRCIDACPVNALKTPGMLDARACLNYWTIEHHGEIPEAIAHKMGNRIFGCDTCQAVCPFNRMAAHITCKTCQPHRKFAPIASDHEISTGTVLTLDDIERMDEETFQKFFSHTPLFRTGLDRIKRNAKIVRNNQATVLEHFKK